MIVIGVDPHKQTHTAAVVDGRSGELVGERTVRARRRGHEQLLGWARALAVERLWALEDCRHVSLSLERFLLARGERVVRVPPRLMGASRKGVRTTGKSDRIDALAVARAGLREPGLPQAFLAGQNDALMHATETLVQAVHLTGVKDQRTPIARPGSRPWLVAVP